VQPASREVTRSFRGLGPPSSALLASGAPPAVLDGRGVFLGALSPGTCVPRDPLLEFGSSSEFHRLVAARARLRPRSALSVEERSLARDPPLLSFLLLEHHNSERPVSPDAAREQLRGGWGLPLPHRCRPQGWLPLDGSGYATVCSDPVKDPPSSVAPRSFAAFFHAARVPGVALQSLPLSRSRIHSRGPLASLRVRVRRPPARSR